MILCDSIHCVILQPIHASPTFYSSDHFLTDTVGFFEDWDFETPSDSKKRSLERRKQRKRVITATAALDQKLQYILMGGICPLFGGPPHCQNKNTRIDNKNDLKSTERAINAIPRSKSDDVERECTTTEKKNILNQSDHSNTTGKAEKFIRNASTANGSSVLQRKGSSLLFQGCIFESSSIIIKSSKDNSPGLHKTDQNFYVLIDNVFFVKKSMDNIKVLSPHAESQLNCPINNIPSTYYLSQGIPLDSIKEISTGKIIQSTSSPIVTTMKLICKNCQSNAKASSKGRIRKIKMTFSSSLIQANQINCDECGCPNQWRLVSLESNFPVWGNGKKIDKEEQLESLPSTIRVMGCISCLRYALDSEKLECGCVMCKNCYSDNESKECRLCEAIC